MVVYQSENAQYTIYIRDVERSFDYSKFFVFFGFDQKANEHERNFEILSKKNLSDIYIKRR